MKCPDTMTCYAAKVVRQDELDPGELALVGVFAHDPLSALQRVRWVWPGCIVLWLTDGDERVWVDVEEGFDLTPDELLSPVEVESLATRQETDRGRAGTWAATAQMLEPVMWAEALHGDVRGYLQFANEAKVTAKTVLWGANLVNNVRKYLGHTPKHRYPKAPKPPKK